jgi:hypothetical protein
VRGDAAERVLEEGVLQPAGLRRRGGGLKRTAPMDKRQFRRCLGTCRRLGFRFGGSSRWRSYSNLQRYKPA